MNATRAVVKIKSLSHLRLYLQFTHMIFIYSQSFIHHLTGLFGTNIMTSSVGLLAQLVEHYTGIAEVMG